MRNEGSEFIIENKESITKHRFYSEWRTAKDGTWFSTRSPWPDVPCYISPVALPECCNYASYLTYKSKISEIEDYLTKQVQILRYNNPGHSSHMIETAIVNRIAYWQGNIQLFADKFYLTSMLTQVIKGVFADDDFVEKISMNYKKYWYSDEIMRISGKGQNESKRTKAKRMARAAANREIIVNKLSSLCFEYLNSNYNVKPTIKILMEMNNSSKRTIEKYGEGLYIGKKENTLQRVVKAKSLHPNFTQQQIADLLKLKKRNVREYWAKELD